MHIFYSEEQVKKCCKRKMQEKYEGKQQDGCFRKEKDKIMGGSTKNYIWADRKRIWCGLPWTFTKYAYSEERLFVTSSLLKTVENEVRLYRVLDLSLSRTLVQKIFGLGTIHISSADKTLGDFDLVNIKNSEEVKEELSALVEDNRDKKRVTNREFMGDDMPDDDDDR